MCAEDERASFSLECAVPITWRSNQVRGVPAEDSSEC